MAKKNFTVTMDIELIQELRQYAFWLPGSSISAIVCDAMRAYRPFLEEKTKDAYKEGLVVLRRGKRARK